MDDYLSPRRYSSVLLIQSARGGIENIEINRIFKRFGLVRHMRWDAKNFARADDNFLAVDPELQRAVEYVGELFVVMAVQRDMCSFLEQDTRDHDISADYELTAYQWIERLDFYI